MTTLTVTILRLPDVELDCPLLLGRGIDDALLIGEGTCEFAMPVT